MRHIFLLFIFFTISYASAQRPAELTQFLDIVKKGDSFQSDIHWQNLLDIGQPVTWNDSVAFLHKTKASRVVWNGDFNKWGVDTTYNNQGTRLLNSNYWILLKKFPDDARIDYKVVVNGEWSTDPFNKNIIMSGTGSSNSELRMPKWSPSPWIIDKSPEKGSVNDTIIYDSQSLGYKVKTVIYTPYNYKTLGPLPAIYITDGHEYTNTKLGSMIQVLDNLIFSKKIEPVIVICIDPREVGNEDNNRRMTEMAINDNYRKFIVEELVPSIDEKYNLIQDRTARAIWGTSLGGLNASYINALSPEVFGKVAIQSPAYEYKPDIYNLVEQSESLPTKVSITTGTMNDTQLAAQKMMSIYKSKMCDLQYIEVNEGHSWGNWRALLDDQLMFLFPSN